MDRMLRCGWIALLLLGAPEGTPDGTRAGDIEFFEARVRPILAENCFRCHGPEKQKAGLRLDSRDAILRGGDNGAVIAPGKPEESRLVTAVGYGDVRLTMPPRGKLPDAAILALTAWVQRGAAWPEEPAPASPTSSAASSSTPPPTSTATSTRSLDITERRASHWAWQPERSTEPPRIQDTA